MFNLKNSDEYTVLKYLIIKEQWRSDIHPINIKRRAVYRMLDSLEKRDFVLVCETKPYKNKITKKYRLTLKGFLASLGFKTLSKKNYVIQKYLQLIPESFRDNVFFYIKKDIQLLFVKNYNFGLEMQNISHMSDWLKKFNRIESDDNDKTITNLEKELCGNYIHLSKQFSRFIEESQKNNVLCYHFASWAEIIHYLLLDYSPKKIENILQSDFDLTTDPEKYYRYFKQNEKLKDQDTLWNVRMKLRDELRGKDFMKKVAKVEKTDLLKKPKS